MRLVVADITSVSRRGQATAAVVLLAAIGGCSDNRLTSPTSPNQLDGTWRLFQMTSPAGVHNEDLAGGRFNVTLSNGAIQAKADCNTCNGTTALSESTLTIGALACTRAACASAPLDTRFTGLLDGALTVRINARLLQLNSTVGELRFER